jgi:RNA polymerase sigma factor (sigma-70 family)
MNETDWLAARFEEQRGRLRSVAYRMLGSLEDADDAVQNAWLRLSRADSTDVDNLAALLTTVVARECLNILRARRTRREEALTDAMVAPLSASLDNSDPEAEALFADSVGPALMFVLDTLAPAERLAFVLHDVFAVPFDQIASIVERSPTAARQLASRARKRVQGASPPQPSDLTRQRQVVDAFLAALREGDFQGLLAVLDPDVLLRDDRAVLRVGTPTLMRGPEQIAAHALSFSSGARFAQPALVNGAVGVALIAQGRIGGALGFTFRDQRIVTIDVISDPRVLSEVNLVLDD